MASKAGANVIVAGSAIFKAKDMKKTISLLRKHVDEYLIKEKETTKNITTTTIKKENAKIEEINIDEILYSPVVVGVDSGDKNIF